MKNKLAYYYSILAVSLVSAVLLLYNLKNYNKKFSKSLLADSDKLYSNYIEKLSQEEVMCQCLTDYGKEIFLKIVENEGLNSYVFPFNFYFIESTENSISFVDQNEDKLVVRFSPKEEVDLLKLIVILKSYGIKRQIVLSGNMQGYIQDQFFLLQQEITFYRFVNVFVLTEQSHENTGKLINLVKTKLSGLDWAENIYIKNLYYSNNAYTPQHFYDSLKLSNSPIVLEELQDQKILNIVLKHVNL
jgi:hypothetical protein